MTTTNLEITPNASIPNKNIAIKVFGVGGAGGQVVDQLCQRGLEEVAFIAVNTDAHALANIEAPAKLFLDTGQARALVNGNAELAGAAAESAVANLRGLCEGVNLVFIIAGLGGGAGTGASPVIARVAKEAGARVLAFVTLPFDWEGSRRQDQARNGLRLLKEIADGVLCLPNQKVLKLIDEKTSLVETFKITNTMISQMVCCIWRLLLRPGFVNVNFSDLCAMLKSQPSEMYFATAEATGENRAREVVEKLLANPLLDSGLVLNEAEAVLVSVIGPTDLTMAEIDRVMEQINRQCEQAHVMMGAALEEAPQGRLTVTVVVSPGTIQGGISLGSACTSADGKGDISSAVTDVSLEFDTKFHARPGPRPPSRFVAPPPDLTPEKTQQLLNRQNGSSARAKRISSRLRQGQLALEIISKGRFEKSEPTIHQGEDLDVPTYIRRGVALN